jgi:cyclin H
MQALRFHFTVHAPFRPLRGFFIDASAYLAPAGLPESVHEAAVTLLWKWTQTDVLFTHPPSQVALAALLSAAPAEVTVELNRYIANKLEAADPDKAPLLRAALVAIPIVVEAATLGPSSPDRHTQLKAKLQACRNPKFDPESAMFRRRKEAGDRERSAKRQRRDEEWKEKQKAQLQSILGT